MGVNSYISPVLLLVLGTAMVNAFPGSDSIHCVTEGRFKDPQDCGSFIDCIPDRTGGLIARRGSCKGLGFHPITKKCASLKKMRGCNPREARAVGADHNLDHLCTKNKNEFICSDCKTVINCINGTAYPDQCGLQDFCRDSQKHGGGVCYPDKPEECTCDKPNEFKKDFYDPHSFFFCESLETDPVIYQCPEAMEFDTEHRQCRNKDGLPPCTSIGVFANPTDCRVFYTCIMTTEGWIHRKSSCNNDTSSNHMFNEVTGQCEDPCLWNNDAFECVKEGRFADPTNCKNYFECIALDGDGQFEQRTKECPLGYEWDSEAREGLGFCVREGQGTCKPISLNKCSVPKSYCIVPETKPFTKPDRPAIIAVEDKETIGVAVPLPAEINVEVPVQETSVEVSEIEQETDEATFVPVEVLPATLTP